MTFNQLTHDFRTAELRLERAMRLGSPLCQTTCLTRHLAELMDRIECFAPESDAEMREKIMFFLTRARERVAGALAIRDLQVALDLMEQQRTGLILTRPGAHVHESELISRMLERSTDFGEMRGMVDRAGIRCSMYDTDYRMAGFSKPNSIFYTRHRDQVMGRHITALVGEQRYTERARRKMEKVMRGTRQIYNYPLELPGVGLRVMQCVMEPVRDTTGVATGIVMQVEDVTERVTV